MLHSLNAAATILVIVATLVGLVGAATFVRGGYVKARLEDAEGRIDNLVGEVGDYKRRWEQSEEDRARERTEHEAGRESDRLAWESDRDILDAKINDLRNTNHALERVKFGQEILQEIVTTQQQIVETLITNNTQTLSAINNHHTDAMGAWEITSTALNSIIEVLQEAHAEGDISDDAIERLEGK